MDFPMLGVETVRTLVDLPPADLKRHGSWSCPFSSSLDYWTWNALQSGNPAKLVLVDDTTVVFHPVWSNSTVGVRGTRLLNGGLYYWEIAFGPRVFGSAMMVGISTPAGRLESREFDPIVGEDEHSWGLSHSGCLFHAGQQRKYCEPFAENVPTVIGVLFDGRDPAGGSLSFFKDGKNLGVAFTQLNPGNRHELYPMVSSTAAKTSMRVQNMRREYKSLRDRCRDAVLSGIAQPSDVQTTLDRIPRGLRAYILQQLWKIDERLGN